MTRQPRHLPRDRQALPPREFENSTAADMTLKFPEQMPRPALVAVA
jgi:hypothetical protein